MTPAPTACRGHMIDGFIVGPLPMDQCQSCHRFTRDRSWHVPTPPRLVDGRCLQFVPKPTPEK